MSRIPLKVFFSSLNTSKALKFNRKGDSGYFDLMQFHANVPVEITDVQLNLTLCSWCYGLALTFFTMLSRR